MTANSTPEVSAVIATAGEARFLDCAVQSVLASDFERFEVIVVDNRPTSEGVRPALVARLPDDERLHYVAEPRRGLAAARNAGLTVARGALVLFTDDDVVVDREWLRVVAGRFEASRQTACVTGRILPLELETRAQRLLEQFASFSKGTERRVYSMEGRARDPLFPYTAGRFGSGANTAVRTAVARKLGGFDPALGAGTPSRGGEELDFYIRLLLSGYRLEYEPAAIIRHRHAREMRTLRRQAFSYGIGLMAAVSAQLVSGPERMRVVRLVPAAIRYFFDPGSRKNLQKRPGYPRVLDALEWAGMAVGPFAYLVSRLLK